MNNHHFARRDFYKLDRFIKIFKTSRRGGHEWITGNIVFKEILARTILVTLSLEIGVHAENVFVARFQCKRILPYSPSLSVIEITALAVGDISTLSLTA